MLSVENLAFKFPQRTLFRELSFRLEPGEALRVCGENGKGKSTLLAVLSGLLGVQEGEIKYVDPDNPDVELDWQTQFTFLPAEGNGLYLKLDALQNLKFWTQLRGVPCENEDVFRVLEYWKLNHSLVRENFAVEKFSTGMRRRLGLARVELARASVWILDEPVYGLDDKGVHLFRESLKKHLHHGGSTIIVSHDTSVFQGMDDYIREITIR